MPETSVTASAVVSGMVCAACEARIGKRLMAEPGVSMAKANYKKNTLHITFDPERVAWARFAEILDEMEYGLSEPIHRGVYP